MLRKRNLRRSFVSDNGGYVVKPKRPHSHRAEAMKARAVVCEHCGWYPPEPRLLHVHHIVQVACGGKNASSNLIVLCPNCHALAHYVSRRSRFNGTPYGPTTKDELLIALRAPRAARELDVGAMRQAVNRLRETVALLG